MSPSSSPEMIIPSVARRIAFTTTLLCAIGGCATSRARSSPILGVPAFPQDSVTRDSTGRRLGALAGVVLDSASGLGVEGAQVSLRSPTLSYPRFAYTNQRGGFVIGKLEPGRYELLVRRLGYLPFRGPRDLRAGVVDTVGVRITISHATLSTVAKERASLSTL